MMSTVLSGRTKVCGIIGDPIGHTMSPLMHNAAFSKMELDFFYVPFRVKKGELDRAIAGVRALNIRGLNVTIPHKVAIMPFLDELDSLAKRIGAVNTIVNDDGVLTGYNSDASGFLQALLAGGVEPAGKKVIILGAGGASRAISFALAERGAHLVILNRQLEFAWAEELASQISKAFESDVEALNLDEDNLSSALVEADVLVNATSVGMSPNIYETPVPHRLIRSSLVVFDIVYNPLKTRLLRQAEAVGAKIISGLDMFVWQGALPFELWTGLTAPVGLMRTEVIKALL